MSEKPDQTALAKTPINIGNRGLELKTLEELWRFAGYITASGELCPKGLKSQAEVLIALELASELGLPLLRGIQSIAVIGGRPSLYGDAPLALCQASGHFDFGAWDESFEGDGELMTAVCTARRKGMGKSVTRTFSVADAKKAKLWGKAGPWMEYPTRMLQMRARSRTLRDTFADILFGIPIKEEFDGVDMFLDADAEPSKPKTGSKALVKTVTQKPIPTEATIAAPVEVPVTSPGAAAIVELFEADNQ